MYTWVLSKCFGFRHHDKHVHYVSYPVSVLDQNTVSEQELVCRCCKLLTALIDDEARSDNAEFFFNFLSETSNKRIQNYHVEIQNNDKTMTKNIKSNHRHRMTTKRRSSFFKSGGLALSLLR